MRIIVTVIFVSLLLACNDSDDGAGLTVDYSSLSYANTQGESLRRAQNSERFATHIKNGIRMRLESHMPPNSWEGVARTDAANDAFANGFSQTNVIVGGVDESDVVKYDGEYMYIAESQLMWDQPSYTNTIKVAQTLPNQALYNDIGELSYKLDWVSDPSLYIGETQSGLLKFLLSMDTSYSYDILLEAEVALYPFFPEQRFRMTKVNVTDPANATQQWSIDIDAQSAGHRKIDNMLYLLVRHSPTIAGLNLSPRDDADKVSNEYLIENASATDLVPHYRINGADKSFPLVDPGDCYIAATTKANEAYTDVLVLAAFNLETEQLVSSVCMPGNSYQVYVSPTSFYVVESSFLQTAAVQHQTVVHKFNIAENEVSYQASGSVPGYLGWGWRSDPSFRMDEYNGDLRIITTWFAPLGGINHQLSVLRQQAGQSELELIAQLPNDSAPQKIGKPGEDIYAVRFDGEMAYVVTFLRIDPLYVLDLSNPTAPQITGELEVPGFSSYLHPIGDNLLFSLGRAEGPPWNGGLKVELFDVSDIDNPKSISQHILGQRFSRSQALDDYRGFTFLQESADRLKITFPADIYANSQWQHTGLYEFEINDLSGASPSLGQVGFIQADQPTADRTWPRYQTQRAVLHNSAVYYIFGSEILPAVWGTFTQ